MIGHYMVGIKGFVTDDTNAERDLLELADGKIIVYPKADRVKVFKALCCTEERAQFGYTDEMITEKCQGGLKFLKSLQGRGVVVVSDHANYANYYNSNFGKILYITCMDLHGEIIKNGDVYTPPHYSFKEEAENLKSLLIKLNAEQPQSKQAINLPEKA